MFVNNNNKYITYYRLTKDFGNITTILRIILLAKKIELKHMFM